MQRTIRRTPRETSQFAKFAGGETHGAPPPLRWLTHACRTADNLKEETVAFFDYSSPMTRCAADSTLPHALTPLPSVQSRAGTRKTRLWVCEQNDRAVMIPENARLLWVVCTRALGRRSRLACGARRLSGQENTALWPDECLWG